MARKQTDETSDLEIGSNELLAAISFLTDLSPSGSSHHTWRVALVAHRLASIVSPEIQRHVFHAGLLQDIGVIGSDKNITSCVSLQDQIEDEHIRSHPDRGAALIGLLPDMTQVAQIVRFHHEWWNGRGYPGLRVGKDIPTGAQILRIADEAVTGGCFSAHFDLAERLRALAPLTGRAWSESLWETLVRSTSDAGFYAGLVDPSRVTELMSAALRENPLPDEMCSDTSVERIFHMFAALTDAAIPNKEGHALRTARFARAIGERMRLSETEIRTIYRAGLVHDCGWVAVPRNVARRPGKYSDQEIEAARSHAAATGRVLSCLPDRPGLVELGLIASSHHEWLNGFGYPRRLTSKQLHPLTRILSVADAFDAMVSISNYRVLSVKCGLMRLEENVGTQFDAAVVKALAALTEDQQLPTDVALAA